MKGARTAARAPQRDAAAPCQLLLSLPLRRRRTERSGEPSSVCTSTAGSNPRKLRFPRRTRRQEECSSSARAQRRRAADGASLNATPTRRAGADRGT